MNRSGGRKGLFFFRSHQGQCPRTQEHTPWFLRTSLRSGGSEVPPLSSWGEGRRGQTPELWTGGGPPSFEAAEKGQSTRNHLSDEWASAAPSENLTFENLTSEKRTLYEKLTSAFLTFGNRTPPSIAESAHYANGVPNDPNRATLSCSTDPPRPPPDSGPSGLLASIPGRHSGRANFSCAVTRSPFPVCDNLVFCSSAPETRWYNDGRPMDAARTCPRPTTADTLNAAPLTSGLRAGGGRPDP